MFPLNLPVQIGGFFPCRREKNNQPTPKISWEISLDLCLILSSPSFIGRAEGELKAKRLALPTGLQKVRKKGAKRLSFIPPFYILWGICFYHSLGKRWAKLNTAFLEIHFSSNNSWCTWRSGNGPKSRPKPSDQCCPWRTEIPGQISWEGWPREGRQH